MDHTLSQFLSGKQLLLEELPFEKDTLSHPDITKRMGVELIEGRPFCHRCGNKDRDRFAVFPCSRCGKSCTYCRACLMMGRVSTCTILYGWKGQSSEFPEAPLTWTGTLSPGQRVAAEKVRQAVLCKEELLVWAVCGAGKTELLFPGIEAALKDKKRVCIATPRTDVVLELAPRLQAVFPSIEVAALYGGSEQRHLYSPLTISTTHQLMRFHAAFDTMIVDEVDAFPYSADPLLHYAVQHARKPSSSMIYLTATPSRKWQKECRVGKRKAVTIPARFHQHPLPVPLFTWCGNWEKRLSKGKLPRNVWNWVNERLLSQTPVLLFVSKIAWIEPVVQLLRSVDQRIEGVHAEDPDRKMKVQRMREGSIPLLVTTTILERGVTFPGLEVAVLGAEENIFTVSALVQIAGRVGRSSQQPTGEVNFFHYGKTEAMVQARKEIAAMNTEARKKGLIIE